MAGNIKGTILFGGVGLPGVSVTDGVDPIVLTDALGQYTIPAADGAYTVVASLLGYLFNPEFQSVVISGSDVTGVDFTAYKELIRQKVLLDQTIGFSGALIFGGTYIDITTGDIINDGQGMISGFSGFTTASGFSGFSGSQGISGYSGYSAFSGYSGYSGSSGFTGFSGFSGQSTSAGTVYFLHNESSPDVVGELELLVNGPDVANTTLPFTVAGDATTALKSWVTNIGDPGVSEFDAGEYKLDFVAWKTNATQATVFFNVYRRDGLSRTLLGTSYATPNLTTSPAHYSVSWQNPNDIPVLSTTRFEIELEAIDVGGGGTQTVNIGIEGNTGTNADYASHIHAGVTSMFSTSGHSGFSGFSGFSGYSSDSGASGQSGWSGISSWSGQSGWSGISGLSGDSGFTGFSGFSGQNGQSGNSGISGWSGMSGWSGVSAWSGFSGFSGQDGQSGASGISGWSGTSAWSGFTGFSGFSGQDGQSGNSGISGWSGTSAWSGFSGFSGQDGQSGFSGWSGVSAWSGQSGFTGFSGFSGQDGQSGFSGFSGYSSPSGFTGFSGFSAFSGYTGFSGASGRSGFSGFSGFSGASAWSGFSGFSATFSGFSSVAFSARKYIFLDIQGGVDDVAVTDVTSMPMLQFIAGQANRGRWTVFVPDDWIVGTNIDINIFWSAKTGLGGNVFWFTEAKSVAIGTSVSGTNMNNTFIQAAPATAYQLTSTGSTFFISGASMTAGALLQATMGRSGNAATDTYASTAQVHHVRLEYFAKKVV